MQLVGALLLAHGALYFYEKINWAYGGQEEAIKEKFVLHMQGKLRMLVFTMTATICQQIKQVYYALSFLGNLYLKAYDICFEGAAIYAGFSVQAGGRVS